MTIEQTTYRRVRLKDIQRAVQPGVVIPVSIQPGKQRLEDFQLTVISCTPHGFRVAKTAEEPEHWAYDISWKCAQRGRIGLLVLHLEEVVERGREKLGR